MGKRHRVPPGGRAPSGRPSRGQRGPERVEGVFQQNPAGFGFVRPAKRGLEDIYLPRAEAARALDNDRVVVELLRGPGRRLTGRLLEVLERPRRMVVGTYREHGRSAWVEPLDRSLGRQIQVPRARGARGGEVVKVGLRVGEGLLGPREALQGEVLASLGERGEIEAELLSIACRQGFVEEFPREAAEEAQAIALELPEKELSEQGRVDLRGMPLLTIDPEDARDHDDAIYVEPRPGGWRLVVAIADVSHYVRPGTALDAEAFRRGTSVYLPDRVLPMLPERLSAEICSLKPGVDRLCLVAEVLFDRAAAVREVELYPAVMRSVARCSYREVQQVLSGEQVPGRSELRPLFEHALALSRALSQARRRRGAIDFDLPETAVELGEGGIPRGMVRRQRLESHRLVEECMLAANEAVARFFREVNLPTLYRFHAEPDVEKLAAFAELAQALGFQVPRPEAISSKDLNAFLEKLEGHREQRCLNQMLLRAMMQAVYSAEEIGHYGLAAEHYLHFTSPIRRYPDLVVHRLLRAHWASGGRRSLRELDRETDELAQLAAHCSERERAAMQVEREVVSYYAALLMRDRIGEEFVAAVSALTDFGFFVELDGLYVEGLVKAESVEPRSRLDAEKHALIFRSGRQVRVGERLKVRLLSVNVARRQIDFAVVRFGEEPSLAARVHRPPS